MLARGGCEASASEVARTAGRIWIRMGFTLTPLVTRAEAEL